MSQFKACLTLVVVAFLYSLGASALEAVLRARLPSTQVGIKAVYDGDDSIYLLGGMYWNTSTWDREYLRQILHYNVTSNHVTDVGRFPVSVTYGAAQSDSHGNMYYFGGETDAGVFSTIFKISPETFMPGVVHPPLPGRGRAMFSAVHDENDNIYLIGGYNPYDYGWSQNITKFDANTNSTQVVAELPRQCIDIPSVWFGGAIYMLGGTCFDEPWETDTIHKYTPETEEVETLGARLNHPIHQGETVTDGHSIFLIGGTAYVDSTLENHYITKFDPSTGSVEDLVISNFPGRLEVFSAVYVQKHHRVYIFGGVDETEPKTSLDTIYSIDLENLVNSKLI